MEEVVALTGIGTVGLLSVILIFLRKLNAKLRKSVLRYEKIEHKFD
ncbi:MAG: hypothetical protein NT129_04095 [Candidatus Aenigmarchaeota archaeon]|jgi:hypothetical protein|nr:hypothetical protein [Candidatus Aenigmarchaeota archaeon]